MSKPLTPKQLARERKASLRRQAKRERALEREYRKHHPVPVKGWERIRFGGTVRVGTARGDGPTPWDDMYVPPRVN